MKTSSKVVAGVAAVGVTGVIAYLLWKRGAQAPLPVLTASSTPYEWSQYTPSAIPVPHIVENTPAPNVEVIPLFTSSGGSLLPYGGKCTSDSQCASGVCINGSCMDKDDWES